MAIWGSIMVGAHTCLHLGVHVQVWMYVLTCLQVDLGIFIGMYSK